MFFLVGESRKSRSIKERFALVTEGKEGGKYGKLGDATALLNGGGRERPHAGEMEADKKQFPGANGTYALPPNKMWSLLGFIQ